MIIQLSDTQAVESDYIVNVGTHVRSENDRKNCPQLSAASVSVRLYSRGSFSSLDSCASVECESEEDANKLAARIIQEWKASKATPNQQSRA